MRLALPALALLLAFAARAAAETDLLEFSPWEPPRSSVYVGEVLTIVVEFGAASVAQPGGWTQQFATEAGFPWALTTPWHRLPEGARFLGDRTGAGSGNSMVVDEAITKVELVGGRTSSSGRSLTTHRVSGAVSFDRPGRVRLEPATLRGALAERFEVDALGRLVPLGVRTVLTTGKPIELDVVAVPTEGRPPGFHGAVGSFRASGRLVQPAAGPGDAHVVMLSIQSIRGEGDATLFAAPTADDVRPLHLLGVRDAPHPATRLVTLDLAPASHEQVLAPLSFPYFEPGRGFQVAQTPSITLPAFAGAPVRTPSPPAPPTPDGEPSPSAPKPWWAILALLVLLVGMGRVRRREARDGAAAERAHAEALRARLLAPGTDPMEAFTQVLAARLGTPPAAVVSPDLARRLEDAGVARDVAAEAAAAMERLTAARYGGGEPAPGTEELAAIAARLGEASPGGAAPNASGQPPQGR